MLNAGSQGGWGVGATTALPNPFDSATRPPGNPFTKPKPKPAPNPFHQSNKIYTQASTNNPFSTGVIANPFYAAKTPRVKRSASPSFKQNTNGAPAVRNPFGATRKEAATPKLGRPSPVPSFNSLGSISDLAAEPDWPIASMALVSEPIEPKKRMAGSSIQDNRQNGRGLAPRKKKLSLHNGHDGRSHDFATQIEQQLARDRIRPPQWPANPGSHAQRQAMETFRESYKAYREKARKSLIRAGLIDDPDRRRTLQQALDFRGISEEMCPEWEKITRIVEYDVRNPEKAPDNSGDLVAIPSLMVKRLARSAAGQDAPLPMDVRSFATLRTTLDYLIDDLIPDDSLLPSKHNFLWDRTRAIRIDLSVQKYNMTPDERTDLIYCLETIARFHVTALHLLSQEGFAAEDFSEQQEIEQLGKTLISLKEVYDDCVEQGIQCVNEAEFRGYYIIFNARNPAIKETVEGWGTRLWDTDGIRTAMCLVESLQNTWTLQGPLNPHAPTELALGAAAIFFSIVSSPQISYTMACFAEIHFNAVRKSMLQIIRKSYSRPRDGPKDITPAFLKERLRFDTEDEAVDFAQKHGIVFGHDGAQRYAILNSRHSIEDPRIRHAFSWSIVEQKRSGRPLPDIIHETVYQEDEEDDLGIASQGESLFVSDTGDTYTDTPEGYSHDGEIDGISSTSPSSPPVTMKPQSPNKAYDSLQPQSTNSSAFSNTNQPPQIPKPPVTTNSIFGSTQTRDSNVQTTSTIFSQPTPSPFGTKSTFPGNSSGSQAPVDVPTLLPSQDSSASNNTPSAPSNGTAPPSIFSFLNESRNISSKPVGNQLRLDSPAGQPLFSPSETRDKLRQGEAGKPPTISSDLLESSRGPIQAQNPNISNSRPLFEPAPQTLSPINDNTPSLDPKPSIFLPQPNPSALVSGQGQIPPKEPASTLRPSFLSRLEQGGINTLQTTPSAAPTTMTPVKDPMGDFTRWFVLADKGLMQDELEAFAVEHVLRKTWEDFKAAEEERIRREEDEKSWAEALAYRRRSLEVTFFYRWREIARKRRVVKRIQLEKEKARQWNSLQSVKKREAAEARKREAAIQEAKELVEKRTKEHAQKVMKMRESTQSHQSLEEALLATGVFRGVRDERAAARHAARDDNVDPESEMLPAEQLRLRSENQRRRRRGLPPLRRYPEAKAYKEGSKTAMLRSVASGTGRDSLSMSTGSLRNSTFSSSYRSSLGFNQNRVSKSQSNITDPYWRMKANGLVQMPNGEYLHESLALPMLREGKRFPGIGDYGLPPESFTPSQSPPAGLDREPDSGSPTPARFRGSHRASRSPSILDGVTQKRKRAQAEDDDLAAYRNEAPASRKRAKSNDQATPTAPGPDQDFLESIADLLDKVTAATKS
ncbi:hypothetical protein GGR51DRAFT_531465 [Nemania sp. FL0031]|nr:hypothetical protein GGR51DRAFT_531465 [Nemania sp. FL0031]